MMNTVTILVQFILTELFRKAFENTEDGIKINGVNISSIRYADDTNIIEARM